MNEDDIHDIYLRMSRRKVGQFADEMSTEYRQRRHPRRLIIADWISQHFPPDTQPSIFNASAGHGQTERLLQEKGFDDLSATEFIEPLVFNLRDQGVKTICLPYSCLNEVATEAFDVVISEDVLEHLPSKEAAFVACRELVRISRNAVIVAVGLTKHRGPVQDLGIADKFPAGGLHITLMNWKWWKDHIAKFYNVTYTVRTASGVIFCGFVK